MIINMLQGLSMSLADSVPGVSGGTIAFILGFYDRFMSALHGLFGRDKKQRKESLIYLLKFGVGWCAGMAASVLLLSSIFESQIYFLSSLFLGLTICAIPFIIYDERETVKGKNKNLIFTALGLVLVVAVTLFRANSSELASINFQSLGFFEFLYLFICGAVSVTAMLLPGISGSTLMLIFGIYVPVISAVKELLHLQWQYLPGLLVLAAGAAVGLIFGSKLISKALRRYRPQMVYLIIGLMAGSLFAIVMGPSTLETPQPPVDLSSFNILGFVIGAGVLVALEAIKMKLIKQKTVKIQKTKAQY